MKLYKTSSGVIIQKEHIYFKVDEEWNTFVNDDGLYDKMDKITKKNNPVSNGKELITAGVQAPLDLQELWACGVTYFQSKQGRQDESKKAGGGDFYQHVYEAERPEIFFKATVNRIVGSGQKVRIRKDSTWDVPEPELTLFISSNQKILGYTIGNDMSSRSIEGENPLYLPQAKSYDKCAALGPCIFVSDKPLPMTTLIDMKIKRKGQVVFEGDVQINQIKRSFDELVSFLYRECSFPYGSFLMTGTGIVPGNTFSLKSGDQIYITIDHIGTLVNEVE